MQRARGPYDDPSPEHLTAGKTMTELILKMSEVMGLTKLPTAITLSALIYAAAEIALRTSVSGRRELVESDLVQAIRKALDQAEKVISRDRKVWDA